MSIQRKKELMERIEEVANGDSRYEVQQEQNYGVEKTGSHQHGFLWLKTTGEYKVEVDMLVYYIQSEDRSVDGEMDVHLATCRSEVLNASITKLPQVNERLSEVIIDALQFMEAWPLEGGMDGLR